MYEYDETYSLLYEGEYKKTLFGAYMRNGYGKEYKDGYFHGFTSNYIPVKLKGNYEINSLINIKLTKENINFDLNQ